MTSLLVPALVGFTYKVDGAKQAIVFIAHVSIATLN